MSSRKASSKTSSVATNDSASKGKNTSGSSSVDINQLADDVSDISLNTVEDAGWEVYGKKSKGKAGTWSQQSSSVKAWGHPDVPQKLGMRKNEPGRGAGNNWPSLSPNSGRSPGRGNATPQSVNQSFDGGNQVTSAGPPMKHGWHWASRPGSTHYSEPVSKRNENEAADDAYSDSDGDDYDDYDAYSDSDSVKSHETRKKNRLLKTLFECMDGLSVDEINDSERQWHCPACKGGPGAIDWYRGLQPLIAHAKTKGSTRLKLHRELAQLLEEELNRRGTSAIPAGEMFGKWQGVDERMKKDIVWPPMVVVMNTRLDKDDNDKWLGMGNQELLNCFSNFSAVKARHSYGPQGHRGMSLLIFEASAVGYLEAERLSKRFEDDLRDRNAWERNRATFYPGGKRQLYGYMAEKGDLDSFNQHCQGKSKLKFEMRSYQEMVVEQLRQMNEDNQQLLWFKNKVAKEQRHSKALEESFGVVSEKLRKTVEQSQIVKLRTKMHHEQNKEEMDYQEKFFKDQLKIIYDARNAKEDDFEKIQQKISQTNANPSVQDPRARVKLQEKEMEEFVRKRETLIKSHEQKMVALKSKHLEEEMAMKQRHYEEELAVENEFDSAETDLMEKYIPSSNLKRNSNPIQ